MAITKAIQTVWKMIQVFISYYVGYRAIWQVIAQVCEVLFEPKVRVILAHECHKGKYCPVQNRKSTLLGNMAG